MKVYFENIAGGIYETEVREYSFEDWEAGKIQTEDWITPETRLEDWKTEDFQVEDRFINHLVKNDASGWRYYDRLSLYTIRKILEEAQKLYWKKVENIFERLKQKFNEEYDESFHKDRLLKLEIDGYEKLLSEEKLPIIAPTNFHFPLKEHYHLNYTTIAIVDIRRYYIKIIRGKRDYTHTYSFKSGLSRDGLYINTEAIVKYYEWLKMLMRKATPAEIVETKEKKKNSKPREEKRVLENIWNGNDYKNVINVLQDENPTIGFPFIKMHDKKLYWQKFNDNKSYLAGFIKVCSDNNRINFAEYSAPTLQKIISNTFNIKFDAKVLQPQKLNEIAKIKVAFIDPFLRPFPPQKSN